MLSEVQCKTQDAKGQRRAEEKEETAEVMETYVWSCKEGEDVRWIVVSGMERKTERGQAAGSSHRHALLSKQLSSQGRVTAGHGGITLLANNRELLSRKAAHDSPMTRRGCNKAKAA